MNEEQNTEHPARQPDQEPLMQAPLPVPPEQGIGGEQGKRTSDDEQDETKELAREFRAAEKWAIGINGALAIVAILALIVYNGQLREMRKATRATEVAAKAAKDSADVARQTLKEMQMGGKDTHALAVAAGDQAKAVQAQTEITRHSAEQTLESSRNDERAWISPTRINLNTQAGQNPGGGLVYQNIGRTPAIDVFIRGTFTFEDQRIQDIGAYLKTHPQALGDSMHLGVMFPGQVYEAGTVLPSIIPPDAAYVIASGKKVAYAIGDVTYKDVFNRAHRTEYCFEWAPEIKAFDACPFHNTAN